MRCQSKQVRFWLLDIIKWQVLADIALLSLTHAHFLLVIVGRKAAVLISRRDALHVRAHRLKQRALKVLAHHVSIVIAEVLTIWRLDVATGKVFAHW